MARLWQRIVRGEKGQALPIVLILLVLGGLLIAPCLSYAATSLNAGQVVEEKVRGVFAAEAGVEDALWCLKNSLSPPTQLPEQVNQMQVAIQTEAEGGYALYQGELVDTSVHDDWLDVTGEMVWVEAAEAYKYTITITWQDEQGKPNIKLGEVGVSLPVGYSYQTGSAASFADNISTGAPNDTLDGAGAHMLDWEFSSPYPQISESEPVRTQTFYITGDGGQDGDYTWVKARREDVWVVSEVNGESYIITATATSNSGSSTTIKAYVWVTDEDYTQWGGNFILSEGSTYSQSVYAEGNAQLGNGATVNGNVIAVGDVQLGQGAIINGNVCAGGDVQLYQDAVINGNVYAGGNVQLYEYAIINGNVYAGGNVQLYQGAAITGNYPLPYQGCGLDYSVNDLRVEILSWQINPQ